MDGQSLNISAEKLAQLQAIFPEVFSEGKIDFQRLKTALGDNLLASDKEHYQLSWAGKTEAAQQILQQTTATLRQDTIHTGHHTFIEGDNLDVLRTLQKSYFGQVKMIYIDPPYNTGNDSFVYPDNYAETRKNYDKRTGQVDENGHIRQQSALYKNIKGNGQFHSVWLSMMYPRLYLSRNLLRQDGVIFISIDDNEAANLKLLCDEVFGSENFVGQWNWFKSATPPNLSKKIKKNIEYILCYQKNKNQEKFRGVQKHSNSDDPITKSQNTLKVLTFQPFTLQISAEDKIIKSGFYGTEKYPNELLNDLEVKNGTNQNIVSFKNRFVWTQDKLDEEISKKTKISLSDNLVISYKKFEYDEEVPPNFINIAVGVETTENAGKELQKLFSNINIFDYPKPVSLIKYLIKFCSQANDIILDFFAGSGTTAQAVMELNEEDGGSRQFVCVQIAEATEESSEAYKAGYTTIADITRARIAKVVAKIEERAAQNQAAYQKVSDEQAILKTELAEIQKTAQLDTNGKATISKEAEKLIAQINKKQAEIDKYAAKAAIYERLDLSCGYYQLADSNFKQWQSDVSGEEAIKELLLDFQKSEESDSQADNMFIELCLKMGLGLNVAHQKENGFYKTQQKERIWFCFEPYAANQKEEIAQAENQPKKLVYLSSCFENDQDLSNFRLELETQQIDLTIV